MLYASASYALLPFPYATGAKLKLLGALAHGVPFLATSHVRAQLDEILAPCLLTNNPKAWTRQLRKVPHPDPEQRNRLREQAAQHAWAEIVYKRMVEAL